MLTLQEFSISMVTAALSQSLVIICMLQLIQAKVSPLSPFISPPFFLTVGANVTFGGLPFSGLLSLTQYGYAGKNVTTGTMNGYPL
jgi:hypothetical protein